MNKMDDLGIRSFQAGEGKFLANNLFILQTFFALHEIGEVRVLLLEHQHVMPVYQKTVYQIVPDLHIVYLRYRLNIVL